MNLNIPLIISQIICEKTSLVFHLRFRSQKLILKLVQVKINNKETECIVKKNNMRQVKAG